MTVRTGLPDRARSVATHRVALPADPEFPQLAIAGDPEVMLELFRAHLAPVSGKDVRIDACLPSRFRCRQSGSRCVLQYALRLAEPRTGRQWNQWVTGVVYAREGEAERLWKTLQTDDLHEEIPDRWRSFEPVSFIPALQMLVQVFPFDRRLPTLRRLLVAGPRRLEPLLLARLGPGHWSAHEHVLEPARYRTELGGILEHTMKARDATTARTTALRCYLKVYRDDRGRHTFDLLRSLSAEGRGRSKDYQVVRPIAYLTDLRTLVLEEAPGTTLQEVLRQGGDAEAGVRRVARAVAAFNQGHASILRRHSRADQLAEVQRAATLVQWACPETRADVEVMTAAVVSGLGAVPPMPIHRDLKPDHVFLSDEGVMFIDLDSAALGDPVRDPAHLFAHLVTRVGLDSIPLERARLCAAAFAEEYFRHVPPAWRDQFPLHCAGALIEVARGIFKRQEPQWSHRVAATIDEARNTLSGAIG